MLNSFPSSPPFSFPSLPPVQPFVFPLFHSHLLPSPTFIQLGGLGSAVSSPAGPGGAWPPNAIFFVNFGPIGMSVFYSNVANYSVL